MNKEVRWLVVKKKINYRKTLFPKSPSYSNIMYYSSLTKLLIGVIIIILGFITFHYITFNHNKVKIKTVKTYKDRYIVPENIVFLGDSITKLYDLDKYYPDNNVVNSGISGNIVSDITNDLYDRVYKYNPSKIFLLIGTNQVEFDDCEIIEKQIIDLIDIIHQKLPFTKIIIESIYPVNNTIKNSPSIGRDNDKIIKINDYLEKESKKYNYEYIDIYSYLKDESNNLSAEYTDDGLHLNSNGYDIVTGILKKYL